jgi:beta-lactamase regulating signal transducer with metallopeptidase domain/transglutaminase-like putative cysteine protease
MEIIVQTINTAGRAFVDFALPMLMQSSLLIAILLAVDVVLRRKVRAVFRYWIWMLVLVKLVLPPSLGSPVSLGTWLGGALQAPTAALREAGPPLPEATPLAMSLARVAHTSSPSVPTPVVPPPPSTDMMAPYRSAPAQAAPVEASPQPTSRLPAPAVLPPGPSVTWQGLVLLAWGVTVAALLLLLVQRMFFVRGLVAQAEEGNPGMRDALAECRARLGLHSRVAVRLSPNAASPAVCGPVRPVILIPQNLASRLHGADLQAVLLHELAHVQRGDLWINLAQTLLQIAYFYHPLLWLANAVIRGAREQAVDETVLVALGDTAPRYPETLVNIAKLAFRRRPALSLRLIGVVESKSALTARIRHILDHPVPKSARLGTLGLAAVALTAAVLLPMAAARNIVSPLPASPAPSAGESQGALKAGAAVLDPSCDSDGDGLSDFQEVHKYLTDPTKADSDGDGTPDGDWNERREYTYSVRTVLRYMPPFDEKGLNDDFQDARVLKQTAQYIEVEVIHYPLATSSDSLPENRNWRQDDAGDARLAEYLAPGATTNWDEQMREDLLAALKADGIDVETLTDKQVVERVSSWLLRRSRSLDKVFTTYYVDFPEGRPRVYPGLEDAFRHEFERDSVHYDWTIDQHFDHELLGKGMFYNRTHGSCTSTAIYLTTVLRALGIPTRIVLATPAVDASDRAQILMVKNAITHHRVRETMLAGLRRSRSGWTNHTFNEVYLGNRWCRLDYSQLGCPILGVDRFGLQTHLYTLRDLSDANFAPTWGRRYARGWRDEFFEHDNPYSAVEVSDLFGAHANIPNPPFTAEDLHVPSNPRPNIFLFYPEQADVWSAVMEVVKDNVWDRTGRAHAREFYENLFEGVWTTKPGDILVLLFSLDTSERVPAGYEDLLPKPWPEIEAQLQQGETVELGGKARDKNVIVLAAPTARELKPLVQNSKLLQAIGGPGAAPAVSPTQPPAVLPPAGQSVKQADGVTAELLGVCTHPSEGKQWWRPDGSPLEPAPYKTTGATEVPQAGLQWYEFALRLPAPADAHVRWVVAGSERGSDSGPPLGSDGEPCRDLRAYKAALPEGKESTDIRLGVATGAWQTRALHDIPRSEGSYPLDEGRAVAFGAAYEKDGCTYLPVTTNFSGDLADYEVVAVDGEGTIHRAAGWYGGGNVLLSMTCRFDLPLARVKEFRLQMRPWTWLEFKNVSLCPRQDKGSEPGASGPTKGVRGASSVKMVATLAGGVTLELLGVCEHPSAGKQWWQPDGSPLDAPYKTTGSKLEPQAGRKDYEFVARYGGAPDIDLAWDVPGSGRASYTGNPLDESGRPVPDLAVYTVQFPEDQAMTKVRIGVAAGQWQTRATHTSPDREGTYAVDGKAVAFGIAYAKDGSTFLPVTTDLFHRDVAFRVVAIRQQGEVCSGGLSGAGGAKLNSLTYRLHCPLSDVKEFQFQTRPWTWLEFPNVALRPAQK